MARAPAALFRAGVPTPPGLRRGSRQSGPHAVDKPYLTRHALVPVTNGHRQIIPKSVRTPPPLSKPEGPAAIPDQRHAPNPKLPGVILAGGLARRMGGGDKSLREIGGQPILSRVIDRLRPQVSAMALNANGDPARFAALGLPVLPDSIADHPGPLAGVLAGLDWAAAEGAPAIVTVAADTPFFPETLVQRLSAAAAAQGTAIALAATPDPDRGTLRHPTFGLWPTALRDDLRAALNDGLRKVVLWTDRHGAASALFDADPFDPFFNINTPEDLATAEALI